jgi:ferredoxin-nitrite reductase
VLRAILDVWKEDLENRLSRAKARLKFMVDRIGPVPYRTRVEERLGYRLPDGEAPAPPAEERDHVGVQPQRQEGLFAVGFPVFLGIVRGEQMAAIADVADTYGGGIRLTRRQNFLLTHIPEARLSQVLADVESLGFPLAGGGLRGSSIACTGEPFCNLSVAETKGKLAEIVRHLEEVFGETAAGLRLNLDGCPNACAHHWVGDLGLQGTTLRERGREGERLQGYDIFLRGGLGRHAAIGRPILRRVPAPEVHRVIERLFRAYLAGRRDGEPIQQFFTRLPDEELVRTGLGGGGGTGGAEVVHG